MIKEHKTNMIREMEDESTGPGVYVVGGEEDTEVLFSPWFRRK